jgi:serine/threonine protein kinase
VPAPSQTFTLCGTPLYLPPEVILNRGHGGGADHWSLGVLIYEMLTGFTPFYTHGMDQIALFRAIVKCRFEFPAEYPLETGAGSIISAFLTRNPSQRLGSLAGGEDGVAQHSWFSGVIDFDQLRQKTLPAPKIPKIKNPLDASNFDNCSHLEDKTKMKFPKLPAKELKVFDDF